jgi:hypothetical protein
MENLFTSITQAIASGNPHAALCVSLTLPDIAAAYEYPAMSGRRNVGARYTQWFNDHLSSKYIHEVGASHEHHVFMNADDFYAMRCAVLHEGKDDISTNNRAVLSKFDFVTSLSGRIVHCNSSTNGSEVRLNIQVEIFCNEIMEEVKRWWNNTNQTDKERINDDLISIRLL